MRVAGHLCSVDPYVLVRAVPKQTVQRNSQESSKLDRQDFRRCGSIVLRMADLTLGLVRLTTMDVYMADLALSARHTSCYFCIFIPVLNR